jgi:hypothetical protein
MKYSVTINDSPRHIVSAKGVLGAVKAALESSEEIGEPVYDNKPATIHVVPLGSPRGEG